MPWSNLFIKRHARLLLYFFALVIITASVRQFIQPSPSPVVLDVPIVQTNDSDLNVSTTPLRKTVSVPTFTDTFWPSFESWKQGKRCVCDHERMMISYTNNRWMVI